VSKGAEVAESVSLRGFSPNAATKADVMGEESAISSFLGGEIMVNSLPKERSDVYYSFEEYLCCIWL